MVLVSQPAEGQHGEMGRRFRLRSWVGTGLLVALALTLGILWLIPANSYILLPGEALAVGPLVSIPGHPPLRREGQLYLTDVTIYNASHLLEVLVLGRLNPNADVEPAQNVAGGLSAQQYNQYNLQLMTDSKQQAEAAALSVVPGYHPHLAPTGPRILYVLPKTPAAHVLRPGDVIEDVLGKRTHRAAEIAPLVHHIRPGQIVSLTVLRNRRALRLSVKTVPSTNFQPNSHGKQALIGIQLQDQLVFPITVHIDSQGIGGPSAGLMFALGIVQRLEHRDLTHGCRVAGTGAIDFTGAVSEIGGAKQKIIAARGAGARYFLVPDVPNNLNPARSNRGSVTILPVKTLRQALNDLKNIRRCSAK